MGEAPASVTQAVALPRVAARLRQGAPLRVVAFGSSSTEGSGASAPDRTYPSRLAQDLSAWVRERGAAGEAVEVLNRGRGGDDAEAMARRLERDVLAERPDLVIWQTGSNDPITGVPPERFAALTRQGILAMRAAGIDVMVMDQQWCPRLEGVRDAAAYREALRGVAAELGVPVIRRAALMRGWAAAGVLTPAQMIGPDGFHMTDAGYARLAEAVAAQVLRNAGLGAAVAVARQD
ncbi:SGNH/GDSL hydrolase family protein [Roseomonas sp. NAR14]|uniref:SGNH/GDSL hydrolase family protein n=1 Tax=Roseomonas acroporae TaxID=2937791 RepID=A0A9X1Y424_9PROT|nr:SGNH/GDSL hydrolase family protein [Roseomonas acroporae]